MKILRRSAVALGLAFSCAFGAPMVLSGITGPGASGTLTFFIDDAAANDLEFGDAATTASGGNGGDGGFSTLHDAGNATASAPNSVTNSIVTGDAIAPDVSVNNSSGINVAGSFTDTGADVFAAGGNAPA